MLYYTGKESRVLIERKGAGDENKNAFGDCISGDYSSANAINLFGILGA
jgi:hypothetical protein